MIYIAAYSAYLFFL